jgi:hypothetical protein
MSKTLNQVVAISAFLVFASGVILFAYLAIYNRYWSDDWCINADLRELGFLGTLHGYTYITTYSSNRVSLIFFSGILNYLGVFGVQIMSVGSISLLAASLYWCVINIITMIGRSISRTLIAILILMTVYYTIYLAPHLYQSLYWRSASLPYFSPIAMGVFIFGLITHQGRHGEPSTVMNIIIFFLAVLAGGFSEAGCATLITCLFLYTVITWINRRQVWARASLPAVLVALGGTLVSMILLISSPTTQHRVGLYGEPASLVDLPTLILKFASDFVFFSFKDLPLPHLVISATAFLLGYVLDRPRTALPATRQSMILILIAVLLAFLIIAASFAPSAYIEKAPPHPRTRIIPRFVLTLLLVFVSYIIGLYANRVHVLQRLSLLAVVLIFVTFAYSVRSILISARNIPIYAERARIWDERDQQIRTAVLNGESGIFVQAIDGLPVGGIRDFDVKAQGKIGYWINRCAARYYGIGSIDVLP